MKLGKKELEQRMQHFERECREAGLKVTHQRVEIFREVAQSIDHPDAETVYRGVRQRVPTVSLDTVYRTLWMLSDLDLVDTLGPPRERARFDANLDQHHHFVCMECGLTRDFYSDVLESLRLKEMKDLGRVESTHLEARGLCTQCAKKEKKKGKK